MIIPPFFWNWVHPPLSGRYYAEIRQLDSNQPSGPEFYILKSNPRDQKSQAQGPNKVDTIYMKTLKF
jgi:hypothetical protein